MARRRRCFRRRPLLAVGTTAISMGILVSIFDAHIATAEEGGKGGGANLTVGGGFSTEPQSALPADALPRDALPGDALPGGPVELALTTSAGGALGHGSVSAAVLPFRRLALGVGFSFTRSANNDGLGIGLGRPSLASSIFARGYILDRPRFRLGLGVATSTAVDDRSQSTQATDGTPVSVHWSWPDARRVDVAVAIEAVRGSLALRLELGVGRVFGGPSCWATYPSGVSKPCVSTPPDATLADVHAEAPTQWRPFLALTLAARPGGAVGATSSASAARPSEPASPDRLGLAVSGSWLRSTDLFDDGHYSDAPTFDAGVEADYLKRLGHGFRVGIGGRYGFGTGTLTYYGRQTEHVVFIPLLFGWGWRAPRTGEEIELLGGIGGGLLAYSYGAPNGGLLDTGAIGVEAGVNYIHELGERVAIVVGAKARGLLLTGVGGVHGELPVQLGVRFVL